MNKVEIAETQFTETLLRLSESIARVRDRKELFTTVIDQIKSVIPVVDTALVVLDQTAQNWQDWTNFDNYQGHPAATQLHQMGYDRFFPVDRFITHTLTHTGIMSVVQLREQYPEQPFGEVMWDFGLREMMFTPLVTRGQTIGVLFFDADQEGTYTSQHLQLFQAFADQIAVAIANILANEEILAREREKTQLLQISEAISRIQNKKQMLRVIYESIRPLFPFDSAGLFITDAEKDILYEVLDSEAFPDGLQNTLTDQQLLGPWRLGDSNLNSWWMQNQVVIRSMVAEAQLAAGLLGERQFEAGLAYGLKQMIGGPLYANGKKIGAICFNARQDDY